MKVELFPILITQLAWLRLLELIQIQRPHLDVMRANLLMLSRALLVANHRLELPNGRRHLCRLRNLMAIVLLTRLYLTQNIVGCPRCTTHPTAWHAHAKNISLLPHLLLIDVFIASLLASLAALATVASAIGGTVEATRLLLELHEL